MIILFIVRIKLNNTEDILVVPLEIEVTSTAGLYASQGSVDFGVGGSLDMPKQVDLFVHNPLKKAVRIHSVSSASKAIKIEYENVKIPSDLRNSKGVSTATKIATLTLDCMYYFCWLFYFHFVNYKTKREQLM